VRDAHSTGLYKPWVVVPWGIVMYLIEDPTGVTVDTCSCDFLGLSQDWGMAASGMLLKLHLNKGCCTWSPLLSILCSDANGGQKVGYIIDAQVAHVCHDLFSLPYDTITTQHPRGLACTAWTGVSTGNQPMTDL